MQQINRVIRLDIDIYHPFQPTLTHRGQSYFGLQVELAKPCEALSKLVYAYVHVKTENPTVYPVVPDGTNILFFSLCRESFGGTQSKILEVALTIPEGEYFGVWFYPGAVRRLFNVNLAEVSGSVVGLDFLQTHRFRKLHEQLYEQSSFEQQILICEHLLVSQCNISGFTGYLDHALSVIYQSGGMVSVDSLAKQVGCSARHLNRIFQLNIGSSVKAFSQTIRMNTFLKRRWHSANGSYLPALFDGLDLGFFDQSHLIKSFKKHGVQSLSPKTSEFMSGFYNAR